ncbi:hypothetical protein Tco_1043449 [Tanacetum coccineum]|uniref:Uncharacterized protein n=1 Tax=Tanacetum coccineum TaxID=301880 RepID=A0ABQ5CNY5_9ASTR
MAKRGGAKAGRRGAVNENEKKGRRWLLMDRKYHNPASRKRFWEPLEKRAQRQTTKPDIGLLAVSRWLEARQLGTVGGSVSDGIMMLYLDLIIEESICRGNIGCGQCAASRELGGTVGGRVGWGWANSEGNDGGVSETKKREIGSQNIFFVSDVNEGKVAERTRGAGTVTTVQVGGVWDRGQRVKGWTREERIGGRVK